MYSKTICYLIIMYSKNDAYIIKIDYFVSNKKIIKR